MKKLVIFSLKGPSLETAIGGAEVYIHEFAKSLEKIGYDVHILSGMDKGEHFPNHEKLSDHIEVTRVKVPLKFLPFAVFTMHAYYLKHLKKDQPLVIESQQVFPYLTSIYKNQIGTIIYHLTGGDFIRKQGIIKGSIGFILEKLALPIFYKSKNIITISDHTKNAIIANGLKEDKITIIPPIVETNSDYSLNTNKRENIVSYVGRFTGVNGNKKIDHVVQAFPEVLKNVPDAKLIIGGYIRNKSELIEIIHNSGVEDAVEFIGIVSDNDKEKLLRKSKVFASPSYQEGFGITYIEANSYGTPVVAYEIPGLDTVPDTAGYMVEKDDVKALSDSMIELLTDEEAWQTMSDGAVANAKRFSKSAIEDQIQAYMNEVNQNA